MPRDEINDEWPGNGQNLGRTPLLFWSLKLRPETLVKLKIASHRVPYCIVDLLSWRGSQCPISSQL